MVSYQKNWLESQGHHLGEDLGSIDPQGFMIPIFPCKLYCT